MSTVLVLAETTPTGVRKATLELLTAAATLGTDHQTRYRAPRMTQPIASVVRVVRKVAQQRAEK